MRRVRYAIEVDVDADGRPRRLRYRGERRLRERAVQRELDLWRDGGRWWRGEAGREVWLLELAGERVVEVVCDDLTARWWVIRVAD